MRRIHVGDLERDAEVYVREIKTEVDTWVVVDQIFRRWWHMARWREWFDPWRSRPTLVIGFCNHVATTVQ
jgi:hypothetical protein